MFYAICSLPKLDDENPTPATMPAS